MYDKFQLLLDKNNITPYKLSKEIGIAQSTLSDWKKGKYKPKAEVLQKIANYFSISISFFYEDDDIDFNKKGTMLAKIAKDKDLIKLNEIYATLNQEDKKLVNDLILFLYSKNQKE